MRLSIINIISGFLFVLFIMIVAFFTVIKKKGEGLALISAIVVEFPTVEGLKYGNPVFVHGLPMGDVSSISIDKTKVLVKIALQRSVQFYRNYSIILKNFSVFGKKAIYIDPGREKFGSVPANVRLTGKAIENPFDMASYILSENRAGVQDLLKQVVQITDKINSSQGTVSLLLNDSRLHDRTVALLKKSQRLVDTLNQAYFRYRTEVGSKTIQSALNHLDD